MATMIQNVFIPVSQSTKANLLEVLRVKLRNTPPSRSAHLFRSKFLFSFTPISHGLTVSSPYNELLCLWEST